MLLARGAARQKEIAVRMSLGAQRFRIVGQLLTESGIIAGLAAVMGIVLSLAAGSVMRALMSVPFEAPLDLRVLGFATLLAAATALLFGLVPALGATRSDTSEILKDGGAGAGYRRSRMRSALVVAQIALSLLLLATSGVFIRTVGVMNDVTTGMERHRLLLASVDPGAMRYPAEKASTFREAAVSRMQSLPGVAAVGTASWLPPEAPSNEQRVSFPQQDAAKGRFARTGSVGGRFFHASGIPFSAGRDFEHTDRRGAPLVAIVNESLARDLIGKGDHREIIGTRLRFGEDSAAFVAEVVGVVGNTTMPTRDDVRPIAYFPVAQQYASHVVLHVRTAGDPAPLMPAVRRELTAIDPGLPLLELSTISERLHRTLTGLELTGRAILAFGGLAVILAAAGVYAVMSYIVAQRTREIGVRVALGARRNAVVALVLRQALTLTAVGIVCGLAGAIAVGQLIASVLHNAKAADPLTVGAVVALLLVMALAASGVPVLRATRVDPMIALRHD
jgi:predicted permease